VHRGELTKQGSRLVRWAVIEGTVRYHGGGKLAGDYRQIAERRGKNKPPSRSLAKCSCSSTTACATGDPSPGQDRVSELGHAPRALENGMTPTHCGEIDDLLEPEESWPERTMLRAASAKECLATESARSKIDQPWCGTRQPNTAPNPSTSRASITFKRTHDQHQHLDTTPLLQECRSALEPSHSSAMLRAWTFD